MTVTEFCTVGTFVIVLAGSLFKHMAKIEYSWRKNRRIFWIARRLGDYGIIRIHENASEATYDIYFAKKKPCEKG